MGNEASSRIQKRYRKSRLNKNEFQKAGAPDLSPQGVVAEFFVGVVDEFKEEAFLKGIGLDGDKVVQRVAMEYLDVVDAVAPADAATYYVQKCATCILVVFFELAEKLARPNPVRARAFATLSTTAHELAYCADLAVEKTEEAGMRLGRTPHRETDANPKTNRGLRTGQTATNVMSLRTDVENYYVEGNATEKDIKHLVLKMELKLKRFGWQTPQKEQGPVKSTKDLCEVIKSIARQAAYQANSFYAPSEAVNEIPQFELKGKHISNSRRSTRFKAFHSQEIASTTKVHNWGAKTMDLLIAYQKAFMKLDADAQEDTLYPKFFNEMRIDEESPRQWAAFMQAEENKYDFTELIAGHFAIHYDLKAWINSCNEEAKEGLVVEYPLIFEGLKNVNADNTTKTERWLRFEAELSSYLLLGIN